MMADRSIKDLLADKGITLGGRSTGPRELFRNGKSLGHFWPQQAVARLLPECMA